MFVPNRLELAWSAGFFDGEGTAHFSLMKHDKRGKDYDYVTTNNRLQLGVDQSSSVEELNRFRRSVGDVGKVYGPYKPSGNRINHRVRYRYSAMSFEHFQHVMACIWQFLCSRKRAQLKRVHQGFIQNHDPRWRSLKGKRGMKNRIA